MNWFGVKTAVAGAPVALSAGLDAAQDTCGWVICPLGGGGTTAVDWPLLAASEATVGSVTDEPAGDAAVDSEPSGAAGVVAAAVGAAPVVTHALSDSWLV